MQHNVKHGMRMRFTPRVYEFGPGKDPKVDKPDRVIELPEKHYRYDGHQGKWVEIDPPGQEHGRGR